MLTIVGCFGVGDSRGCMYVGSTIVVFMLLQSVPVIVIDVDFKLETIGDLLTSWPL